MAAQKDTIIQEAQRYVARGQIDKAIAEWQKLLKDAPFDGNIFNTIGDLHLKRNAKLDAIEAYEKAADVFRKNGFDLKALAVYKKIVGIDPNRVDAHLALAELNASRGLLINANESYLAVAEFYTRSGLVEKALGVYLKMADLNPGNVKLRMRLAEMYLREGLTTEGIGSYLEVARRYREGGADKEAEQAYRRVLQLEPGSAEAVVGLGQIHLRAGRPLDAMEEVQALLRRQPDHQEALTLYGRAAAAAGRLDEAIETLRRVVEQDPSLLAPREILGGILLEAGRVSEALQAAQPCFTRYQEERAPERVEQFLREAIRTSPDLLEPHRMLADHLLKLGREREVIAEYETLAEIYSRRGEAHLAINVYQLILEKDPDNLEVRSRLSALLPEEEAATPEAAAAEEAAPMAIGEPAIPETVEEAREEAPEATVAEDASGMLGIGDPAQERVAFAGEDWESSKVFDLDVETPAAEEAIVEDFTEVEVYVKYGLLERAIEQLESMVERNPRSLEAHRRLKALYQRQNKKEKILRECLTLSELYEQLGRTDEREQVLREAFGINPNHWEVRQRLGLKEEIPTEPTALEPAIPTVDLSGVLLPEQMATTLTPVTEEEAAPPEPAIPPTELEEDLAEAEFYVQQGLDEEAVKVYLRVLTRQPDLDAAREKLEALQQQIRAATPEPSLEIVLEAALPASEGAVLAEPAAPMAIGDAPQEAPAPVGTPPLEEAESEPLLEDLLEPEDLRAGGAAAAVTEPPAAEGFGGPTVVSVPDTSAVIPEPAPASESRGEEEIIWPEIEEPTAESLAGAPEESVLREMSVEGIERELEDAFRETLPSPEEPGVVEKEEEIKVVLSPDTVGVPLAEEEPAAAKGVVEEDDFVDLAAELKTVIEETPAPSRAFEDKDMEDLFYEFKQGIEQSLGEEDYETHYNLGIAYKEMGLLGEAIEEFQLSSRDPARFMNACTMLGMCYMEKGQHKSAINEFRKGLAEPGHSEEEYMALQYELGTAYAEAGFLQEALEIFQAILMKDPGFREVSAKAAEIEERFRLTRGMVPPRPDGAGPAGDAARGREAAGGRGKETPPPRTKPAGEQSAADTDTGKAKRNRISYL
ncbi:MAG: tetratricopeptide repeat protein [Nitrospirae bacterium]|nr:tetratricopeptide repeat protein [Nitrospirota bacterium]